MLIRLRSVPNKRAARSDRDINKPLSCGRMVEVRVILDAERDANGPPPRVQTSLTTCCAHKTTLSCGAVIALALMIAHAGRVISNFFLSNCIDRTIAENGEFRFRSSRGEGEKNSFEILNDT